MSLVPSDEPGGDVTVRRTGDHIEILLSPEAAEELVELADLADLEPQELIGLIIQDVLGVNMRRRYASSIQKEEELWRSYLARVAARASLDELLTIHEQLTAVRETNAMLRRDMPLERRPALERLYANALTELPSKMEWPALPRPPKSNKGGRPRLESDPDLTWLRSLGQVVHFHFEKGMPWVQAYAQASLSESQGLEYRRRLGLLDDDQDDN